MAAPKVHHPEHPIPRNPAWRFPLFAVALAALMVVAMIAFFTSDFGPSQDRVAADVPDSGQRAPVTAPVSGG